MKDNFMDKYREVERKRLGINENQIIYIQNLKEVTFELKKVNESLDKLCHEIKSLCDICIRLKL